jgi:hypothetical protein
MALILQPYEIPVTYGDLSNEEVILDIFHSLEKLSTTLNDIYGRVEKRLGEEKLRVSKINSRISTCYKKVQVIKGTNKQATTVFSTAKYPAPKSLALYPTILSGVVADVRFII